ncbi:hypothetical protein [Oceanobacillus bengalensis]|uniref:Uncharacterized protein n=1 Tax=Oceanobacillus bengalensis TaxID=1435466 RepID=A0A494YT38_9BACI|nr:hypothetical protein [Oceanobacillus bengalensis]RKQ13295.1 hypothetical protein D8M05_16590 [Oceanobacillus bengalensis]
MKKYQWGFVASGCVLTILFLIVVNFLTSEEYLWFIYPTVLLLLLPLGLYSTFEKKHILFSIVASFILLVFLVMENYTKTPGYPWVLYAAAPIVLWPIISILGKRNKNMFVASTISMLFILYYTTLNIYLAPTYPWAIFPAFAILWWPLCLYHIKKKTYFTFSLNAALFISLFFISVNAFFSPNAIWAVYPIFVVLWWPLSMYYFYYRRKV